MARAAGRARRGGRKRRAGSGGLGFPPGGFCASLAGSERNRLTRHVVFRKSLGLKRWVDTVFFLRSREGRPAPPRSGVRHLVPALGLAAPCSRQAGRARVGVGSCCRRPRAREGLVRTLQSCKGAESLCTCGVGVCQARAGLGRSGGCCWITKHMAGILLYLQVGDSLGKGDATRDKQLEGCMEGPERSAHGCGCAWSRSAGLAQRVGDAGGQSQAGRPAGFLERQHCPPALLLVSCVCDFR